MAKRSALVLAPFLCWLLWTMAVQEAGAGRPGPIGGSAGADGGRARLVVVASIFPLADLVRQIGGEQVEVETLLPPGASPHTFEPTPRQVQRFSRAQVFARIGAGLELWAEKLLGSRKPSPRVMTAAEGIPLFKGTEGVDPHQSFGDPHIWLDPVLVRTAILPRIVETLGAAAPQHVATFRERARRYSVELEQLDRQIRERVSHWQGRKFIVFHSAWRYFGRRYGLQQISAIVESPGKEPSARDIAHLVDVARAHGVHVIFCEPQFNPKPAQVIAQEMKGRVLTLDPLGGEGLPGRNTYIGLMNYNLRALEAGLKVSG